MDAQKLLRQTAHIIAIITITLLKIIWAIIRWAGRTALWIMFWPAAFIRSRNKKADKRTQAIIQAVNNKAA